MTHSSENESPKATNRKVYEWASLWDCKPRRVIQVARQLDIRVQNRLTRITPTDAKRILAAIQTPSDDVEVQ
ncbi:MAG: hypothetical protein DHS20C16_17600 [Phycisphaerae bacterium]|nr:MAG: hypothetical protein DHS20C16_17600 [Phycisphaerae bacterium]